MRQNHRDGEKPGRVLLAGALWFCVTLEARIERKKALRFIEELREFVHAIDVTQLHYTPNLYRSRQEAPLSKPAIDETYLLSSTQMLGVISNLAPLYMRGATGDSILRAAPEIQMLAMAISTKHPAKAEAVRRDAHGIRASEPDGGRMRWMEAARHRTAREPSRRGLSRQSRCQDKRGIAQSTGGQRAGGCDAWPAVRAE